MMATQGPLSLEVLEVLGWIKTALLALLTLTLLVLPIAIAIGRSPRKAVAAPRSEPEDAGRASWSTGGRGDRAEDACPSTRPPHEAERQLRPLRVQAGRSLAAAEGRERRWTAVSRGLVLVYPLGFVALLVLYFAGAPNYSWTVVLVAVVICVLVGCQVHQQVDRAKAEVASRRDDLEWIQQRYDEAYGQMLDADARRLSEDAHRMLDEEAR